MTAPPVARRVARMVVSGELMVSIFRGGPGYYPHKNPLPDDAWIVGVEHDPRTGCVTLYLASDDFRELAEGETPPLAEPSYRQIPSMALAAVSPFCVPTN